jgi:6-phosphogluconolactonase
MLMMRWPGRIERPAGQSNEDEGEVKQSGVICTYQNLESLSRGAADLFVTTAIGAVRIRGRFAVALSGGRTPVRAYELLAQPPWREQVPWEDVYVFWGDERCVLPGDPRSNARMARLALLDHVPIPAAQIHPISCAGAPAQGSREYEDTIRSFFEGRQPRFDLIFLGLGENGHTASLFPETPVLDEGNRWAAEVYVPEQRLYRVTLTPPIINQGKTVAFLVAGANKAAVLQEVLEGQRDPHRLPAQLIQPISGDLHWLVDQEAARNLSHQPQANRREH